MALQVKNMALMTECHKRAMALPADAIDRGEVGVVQ
jgi:hypothetical protein